MTRYGNVHWSEELFMLMVRVWQMIRVGTQQFDMDISVTKTMYKLVLF